MATNNLNQRMYNDPAGGIPSSIGPQMNDFFYHKKALIEARKEQYFMQLADVKSMPKHFGKKMKLYHYLPLLDDANINDQGIDAQGIAIRTDRYYVQLPATEFTLTDAAAATAAANAINAVEADVASTDDATVTVTKTALNQATLAQAEAILAAVPGSSSRQGSGNLYGSSKDIGTITGKLPMLSETGGRVNRVGFKRKEVEGTLVKQGFYDEYTQESLDFDSDEELRMHVNREMINGAVQITEAALQVDLLTQAGVVKYAGGAMQDSEMDETCVVTYDDLLRLSIDLDNNRTPKHTKIITGTRNIDTKVIPAARVMYIGSELLPTLHAMKDMHGNPAFIEVQHYAAGTTVLNGEVGSIGHFRVVVVPEMLNWSGAGAEVGDDTEHHETNGRFNVYPMLVVGSESFSTIGFQTDGKTVKFRIKHSKPGSPESYANDPYGETGFMSIKWYYGFILLRSERLAVLKTVATL